MTERYNVAASAVLGDNYEITNIEASDYNPTIDDYITVTITVNDVYGDSVEGENVTVTASEGTFAQLNGSDITSASTVTGTTNSSGQFTLTYNCTEWGLITFTANNKTVQCKVIGFKSKSMWNGTLYYDNEKVQYVLNQQASGNYNQTTWTDSGAFDTVPSDLRPKQNVYSTVTDTRMTVRVNAGTGKIQYVTGGASISNPYIQCVMTWYLP